ncbi:MAG: hypothetical protein HZA03_10805 [Nitrospinae bacterium]|nr:hypothetical protein [Nitrospinota bacterium]
MKIDGIAGLAAQRQPAPAVLDTSSSAANGAGDAQNAFTPAPAAAPASPSQAGGLLAGRLQMDLHFALAESYSGTVSRQSANGYQELRTSVEKRFQADYHFDMSFITQLDATAQKMGSLGADMLNQFVGAASKLSSLNEKDLQNFTQSADNLFNELAKTTGVDGAAFDGAKQMLKSSVSDFIHMVQGAIAGGPDTAGAAPGQIQPGASGTPPPPPPNGDGIDFQKFRDEAVKKFDDAFSSYLQSMMASAQKTMLDYQQAFLDALTNKKDGSAAINEKSGGDKDSAGQAA